MIWVLTEILVFILGLCLGSFLNVVIHRLPAEDMTISRPRRSVCPACGQEIAWYDNLPILSYILLLGRCRHCRGIISVRYPLVELLAGLMTLAVFYKSGLSLKALAELYLVLALLAITFIDLKDMIIPDAITLPGMVIGLLSAIIIPDISLPGAWLSYRLVDLGVESFRWLSIIGSVLGLLLGGGLIWFIIFAYRLITGKEGMGGGDLTLLAMIGAFLGWRSIFFSIFFGSFFALAAYLVLAARERRFELKAVLPFGPFLSLAALVFLFFGDQILDWYFTW